MADVVSKPVERTVRGAVRGPGAFGHRGSRSSRSTVAQPGSADHRRAAADRSPFLADLAWHVGRTRCDPLYPTRYRSAPTTRLSMRPSRQDPGLPGMSRFACIPMWHELDRRARKSALPRGVFVAGAEAIVEPWRSP